MSNKQIFHGSVLMEFDENDRPLGERVITSSSVDNETPSPLTAAETKKLFNNLTSIAAGDFVTLTKTSNGQIITELSSSPLNDDFESNIIFAKNMGINCAMEIEMSISQRIRYDLQTLCLYQNAAAGADPVPDDIAITSIYQSSADLGVAYNAVAGTILTIVLAQPFQGYLSDWIHVYGLVDNRLNYPNLAVKFISNDRKTLTCGFSDEAALPSLAVQIASPGANAKIKHYNNIGGAKEGFGFRFTSSTPTSGALVSVTGGSDVQISGTLIGDHRVTLGSTAPVYNSPNMNQYELLPTSRFRLEARPDMISFEDRPRDNSTTLSLRNLRTSVKPTLASSLTPRIRHYAPKSMTRPIAKITSAVKTGTTTATITTPQPHGLVTGNWITIKGNRDQVAFANFATPVQVTLLTPTTFTCVYGTAVTATTNGGSVHIVNGAIDQQGILAQVVQSAQGALTAGAPDQLILVGSASWSTGAGVMNVGDYVELYGLVDGAGVSLGLDGSWKVSNIATTQLILVPVVNIDGVRVSPALTTFGPTNCGGSVLHRTTVRIHTVGFAEWTDNFTRIDGQGTLRQDKAVPVNILNTVPVSGTVALSGNPAVIGSAAEDAAASTSPVVVGGVVRTASSPTTLVAGDAARDTMGASGAKVTRDYAVPEATWNYTGLLTTATAVAAQTAAGAGLKRFPVAIQAINTGAAAVDLILLDGATERWRMTLPVNVPFDCVLPVEILVTANTALNVNLSAANTGVRVNMQGHTNP